MRDELQKKKYRKKKLRRNPEFLSRILFQKKSEIEIVKNPEKNSPAWKKQKKNE
jgi:hypothetical protein